VKWHKILILYILHIALLNAHALHLMQNKKHIPLPDFKMSIIRGFLKKREKRRISSRSRQCSNEEIPQHLIDRHFTHYVPNTTPQKNAIRKFHEHTSSIMNPRTGKTADI
jgi:hypothetical protein